MLVAELGAHPSLSLAELKAVYGQKQVSRFCDDFALVDATTVNQHLGGVLKIAEVLHETSVTEPQALVRQLEELVTQYLESANGKLTIGLSFYRKKLNTKFVKNLSITLKQQLKKAGHSVRMVPNNSPTLSSAQVLHNKLTTKGYEFVVVIGATKSVIARTIYIQDIVAYSKRDYGRPARDARVGMLPPKLAQIMINLALRSDGSTNQQTVRMPKTVLDPFCGTGVVLQEALLMGYNANGTDIDKRMVAYTKKNLKWLADQAKDIGIYTVQQADARNSQLPTPINAVVCETHLGPPLRKLPEATKLSQIRKNVNQLVADFLSNIDQQLKPGTPLCITIPFWATPEGPLDLPLVDQISKFGYNHRSFEGILPSALRYRRKHQVVGRLLLVLEKQ